MLTVAYIGFGTSVKRYHLPYVERRKDIVRVKYIYRRKEDVEKEGTQEESWYPQICFTSDLDQVMEDDEVNLIVVNTPNPFHTEYSLMALAHGKHVLCEKPFAQSLEEAQQVLEFAKQKRLLAMPNQNRRFDADMRTVRKVIASGKLGEIVEFESHYDYFDSQRALSKMFAWIEGIGIHPIDQVIDLFGIPQRVSYDCRSIDFPGQADTYWDIDLFYAHGMKAIVKTSMYIKLDYPRFIVHGKKGSFLMPSLGHQSSAPAPCKAMQVSFDPLPEAYWGTLSYVDEHHQTVVEKVPLEVQDYGCIYQNIDDVLFHRGKKLISDEQTLAVLRIVKEAEQAARAAG